MDGARYLTPFEHEQLLVRRGERSGVVCVVAVHSTARGPALGGCRLWTYDDVRAAVRDALRLSRGMTFKSAVAGLPLGGGKGVIMVRPDEAPLDAARREAALLDFGDTVDALGGAYVTAEDVGVSSDDMEVVVRQTPHVTGRAREHGGSGDPSPWTALGVEAAMRAACDRHFGSPELRGRSVALSGLGHVGLPLAELLTEAGVRLLVTDIAEAKRADADRLGATWIAPAEFVTAAVDVLCPCALGGVLDHETVPQLQAPVVAGAANNQLAADDVALLLAERGVTWAPDFVANAGGIINISVELEPEGYDPDRARARVLKVGDTVREVLAEAASAGSDPLAAALALARERVAEGAAEVH